MDFLVDLISNPYIAGAIVSVLVALLPADKVKTLYKTFNNLAEKFPIVGALFKILRLYLDRVQAGNVTAKIQAAEKGAFVMVEAAEQLKKTGKLDSGTAAAQVTAEVAHKYDLDEKTARTVTEAAVRDMNRFNSF